MDNVRVRPESGALTADTNRSPHLLRHNYSAALTASHVPRHTCLVLIVILSEDAAALARRDESKDLCNSLATGSRALVMLSEAKHLCFTPKGPRSGLSRGNSDSSLRSE